MASRNIVAATAALLLVACSGPAGREADGTASGSPGAAKGADDPASEAGDENAELPSEFIQTAWRAIAEDGARYTTYLDEEGRYRDLRNGDPWQEGSWETDSEDRLCFLPDAEGGVLRCWHPDRMQGADYLIASSDDGRRIRLERADYSPPEGDGEE